MCSGQKSNKTHTSYNRLNDCSGWKKDQPRHKSPQHTDQLSGHILISASLQSNLIWKPSSAAINRLWISSHRDASAGESVWWKTKKMPCHLLAGIEAISNFPKTAPAFESGRKKLSGDQILKIKTKRFWESGFKYALNKSCQMSSSHYE